MNSTMKRTYQENKSLYESIMRDVAKTVKRHLDENNLTDFAPLMRRFNGFKENLENNDMEEAKYTAMRFMDIFNSIMEDEDKDKMKKFGSFINTFK